MPGKILNLKKAGEILGVTDRTIQNIIERGDLRGFMVGARWRVEESELNAYIDRQKNKVETFEQRQPGFKTQIEQEKETLTHASPEEVEEYIDSIIEMLHLNPHLKAKFEEKGVFYTLQPEITVEHSHTSEPVTLPTDAKERV